jgi:peptidoglycan hydrolase-like protein with peptidoglycan-binding domain
LTPEPARIREIQQALAREGYYQGEPTGKWDEPSMAAMKQFQAAKGLAPTGKLEALSLQKLGLGSPVAGLAPPNQRPAPPANAPPAPTKPPL